MSTILGLESSCDETAAAVVDGGRWVRSNIIASQHDLHAEYGGVVPEIASRAHLERLWPVMQRALDEAGASVEQLDAVAVGNRPGLIGSLLVGVSAAQAMAWAIQRPLIGIDHVQAHLYAATMPAPRNDLAAPGKMGQADEDAPAAGSSCYPALGLVVSGGHTTLYRVDSPLSPTVLGATIDDAVGEAYDKAAVILGLGYPGGPAVDRAAARGRSGRHRLPRSLLAPDSLDFSFSGLKTALLYKVRGRPVGRGRQSRFERSAEDLPEQDRCDLARAFQEAAIETLMTKVERGIAQMASAGHPPRSLLMGGGVVANSLLRSEAVALEHRCGIPVRLAPMALCLDNAAMIAGLAWHRLNENVDGDGLEIAAVATPGRAPRPQRHR